MPALSILRRLAEGPRRAAAMARMPEQVKRVEGIACILARRLELDRRFAARFGSAGEGAAGAGALASDAGRKVRVASRQLEGLQALLAAIAAAGGAAATGGADVARQLSFDPRATPGAARAGGLPHAAVAATPFRAGPAVPAIAVGLTPAWLLHTAAATPATATTTAAARVASRGNPAAVSRPAATPRTLRLPATATATPRLQSSGRAAAPQQPPPPQPAAAKQPALRTVPQLPSGPAPGPRVFYFPQVS